MILFFFKVIKYVCTIIISNKNGGILGKIMQIHKLIDYFPVPCNLYKLNNSIHNSSTMRARVDTCILFLKLAKCLI